MWIKIIRVIVAGSLVLVALPARATKWYYGSHFISGSSPGQCPGMPGPTAAYGSQHETFNFMMSLPAMSFGERTGQEEVGGFTWRVQTTWLCLGSALKTPWLALGGPFLSSYAQTDWENSPLTLLDPHSQQWSLFFSLPGRAVLEKSHFFSFMLKYNYVAQIWNLNPLNDKDTSTARTVLITWTHHLYSW